MSIVKTAAQLFGMAAVAVGCLAPVEAKAEHPHGGGHGGHHEGHGGGHGGGYGGYRWVNGGWYTWPTRYGGYLYNRPGDGLPPLPAYRTPGGGWVVNRLGDGIPPIYLPPRW